jgi:hypothetical protein
MIRATIAVVALGLSMISAQAADIYERAEQNFDNPQILFDGLGVDVGVGYAMTAVEVANPNGPEFVRGISADGLTGVVGVDYMFVAGKFRVGPYAEYGLADVTTEVNDGGGDFDVLKQEDFYGGGAQFGFVSGTSFFGVRVGYEHQAWVASNGKASVDVEAEALLVGLVYAMALTDTLELKLTVDALDYYNVEAGGEDLSPIFDESLQGRAMARIVWRPDF